MVKETTSIEYKYHIYELINGEWQSRIYWTNKIYLMKPTIKVMQDARSSHLEYLNRTFSDSTFKLVTEKIITIHEFIEE